MIPRDVIRKIRKNISTFIFSFFLSNIAKIIDMVVGKYVLIC